MKLISVDFNEGDTLPSKAVNAQIGGQDKSPVLVFDGVPATAKSLALTCYDPDAPTGSGFWHWIVVNIPVRTSGQLCSETLPEGAVEAPNDANMQGYMGALPPAGDPAHRYVFTLHALSCDSIDAGAMPQAYVRFTIKTNELASASTTAVFANTAPA